jgi:hypothetical protein
VEEEEERAMAVEREAVLRDEREITEPVLAGLGPRPATLGPVVDLAPGPGIDEAAEGGANLRRRLVLVDLLAVSLAWVPSMLAGIGPA